MAESPKKDAPAWVTKSSDEQYARRTVQYTKAQKAANWWDYHKWIVLGGIAVAALAVYIIYATLTQVKPDLQVAVVDRTALPTETLTALTEQLQTMMTDQNGDGKVVITLNEYTISFDENDEADAYMQMAGTTKLSVDIQDHHSYLYLIEDPVGFQKTTMALRYLDGTGPTDTVLDELPAMTYRWADCPALAGLELGEYHSLMDANSPAGNSQDLMSRFYVGRCLCRDEEEKTFPGGLAFWHAVTEGATTWTEK